MSIARQADRLQGMVTWARVVATKALAGAIVTVWTRVGKGERKVEDQLQVPLPYGFQSAAKPGADALVLAVGSNPDQRITLMIGDRRYNIELAEGEVAIVDDLQQKVHLTRTGIVVDADSIKLGGSATLGVARATDPIDMGGVVVGSWSAWATLIAAVPGMPPAPTVAPTIDSGSAVVKAE